MAARNRHHDEVAGWLRSIGAVDPHIECRSRSGHPKIVFIFRGVVHRVPIARTPSDRRAALAMRGALRHRLGLVGPPAAAGGR